MTRQISLSAGRENYAHRLYLPEGYRIAGSSDDYSGTMARPMKADTRRGPS